MQQGQEAVWRGESVGKNEYDPKGNIQGYVNRKRVGEPGVDSI